MILHNISDPWMESAKCFFYLKSQKLADILFFLFAFLFIFTRNFIYLPSTIISYWHIFYIYEPCKLYYFLYPLCICLGVLNLIWTIFILRMVFRFLKTGKCEGDIRADEKNIEKIKEE